MLFTKVILENFQSHAYTEIELDAGLNVIVGESDRGKSAVIRALNWLIYNEPRGADFIRAGERECRVTVHLKDGSTVQRERTPSKNRYIVTRQEESPEVYEGFGTRIPEEVSEILGVKRVLLDDNVEVALNISKQLDPPFLISEPGSLKSKSIGRLYNVHIIDGAVRDTVRDINVLQREERRLEQELEEIDGEMKRFDDLPSLEVRLAKGESLFMQLEEIKQRNTRLISLAGYIKAIQTDIMTQQKTAIKLKEIKSARDGLAALSEQVKRGRDLLALSERLRTCKAGIAVSLKVIRASEKIAVGLQKVADMEELLKDYGRLKALDRKLKLALVGLDIERHKLLLTAKIPEANMSIEQAQKTVKKARELQTLTRRLNGLTFIKEGIGLTLCKTEELKYLETKMGNYTRLAARLAGLINCYKQLNDVKLRINRGLKYIDEHRKKTELGLKQYEIMLQKMGRCPVCLSEVDSSTVGRIIKEFGG